MLRSSTLTQSVTVTCVRHSHRQWHQSIPVNYRVCDASRNTLSSNSAILKWKRKSNTKRNSSGMGTFTTRALAQPLRNADELIDSVETFIFDCDGMLLSTHHFIFIPIQEEIYFYTFFIVNVFIFSVQLIIDQPKYNYCKIIVILKKRLIFYLFLCICQN